MVNTFFLSGANNDPYSFLYTENNKTWQKYRHQQKEKQRTLLKRRWERVEKQRLLTQNSALVLPAMSPTMADLVSGFASNNDGLTGFTLSISLLCNRQSNHALIVISHRVAYLASLGLALCCHPRFFSGHCSGRNHTPRPTRLHPLLYRFLAAVVADYWCKNVDQRTISIHVSVLQPKLIKRTKLANYKKV